MNTPEWTERYHDRCRRWLKGTGHTIQNSSIDQMVIEWTELSQLTLHKTVEEFKRNTDKPKRGMDWWANNWRRSKRIALSKTWNTSPPDFLKFISICDLWCSEIIQVSYVVVIFVNQKLFPCQFEVQSSKLSKVNKINQNTVTSPTALNIASKIIWYLDFTNDLQIRFFFFLFSTGEHVPTRKEAFKIQGRKTKATIKHRRFCNIHTTIFLVFAPNDPIPMKFLPISWLELVFTSCAHLFGVLKF